VKVNKTVLIVTDGSEETEKMAEGIASALKGNKVTVKTGYEFLGNDLLPAEVFLLGCQEPGHDSFDYLSDLLQHINLAGRLCGVFTPKSKKTARYLAGLVHDSEITLNPVPLFSASAAVVKRWALKVVSGPR